MNDPGVLPQYMLDVRELTAEVFAPYGEVITPLRAGRQEVVGQAYAIVNRPLPGQTNAFQMSQVLVEDRKSVV